MKIKKKVLGHLERCYALAPLWYQNEPHFLVASELALPCLLFDADGNQKDVVWQEPGGVMSMVQVPGTDGQFLATLKFYGFNNAGAANLSVITPRSNGKWEIRTLAELPFVHRIDVLERNGVRWLIACTLKSGHEYDNDWRFPGKVYAAVLPENLQDISPEKPLELTVLMEGLQKNHGYYQTEENGVAAALICAENGIFRFTPPPERDGEWSIETLSHDAASDAALVDFDEDGICEMGVIAPFHGDQIRFYKPGQSGYEMIYEYGRRLPFSHAFYGGMLCGKPALVVGHRDGERDLLAFTYRAEEERYSCEWIDRDCGAANVLHYVRNGKDILISANREINEIAMYELER